MRRILILLLIIYDIKMINIVQCSVHSVFLIDHAWTYEVNYARTQLKTVPDLADRMASLMGITSNAPV